jgi:hypothetical protein
MGDLWDGIEDAEIFERGKYMEANFIGVVEIKKTLAKETLKNGMAFIVEMVVVETNMPEKHPKDQKVTWYQGLKDKTVAFPAIAAWAAACLGFSPSDKEHVKNEVQPLLPAAMKEATDSPEDNPFIGVKLKLSTILVKTKKGGDFTVYNFEPLKAA